MKRPALASLAAAVVAATLFGTEASAAPQLLGCSISVTPMTFGTYSTYSAGHTDSMATITYQCTVGLLIRVELGTGGSGTFDPRRMANGSHQLDYNLYLDSGYSTIWGDGSGTTGRISHLITLLFPINATVYGRIPAQQDVAAGGYSDSVVATIVF